MDMQVSNVGAKVSNQRVFLPESGGRTVNWMIYNDDAMETKNFQGCNYEIYEILSEL